MDAIAPTGTTSETLWHGFQRQLLGFVRRRVPRPADADDVVQEIFLRIHANLDALADADRAVGWVFRIAHHAIADHYRALARAESLEQAMQRYGFTGMAEEETPLEEIGRCVEPFLGEVPEPYAEAVRLVDVDGLTHAAVAKRLGISVSGAKSRVQRGRARLRELLLACCELELDARGGLIACRSRGEARRRACGASDPACCRVDGEGRLC